LLVPEFNRVYVACTDGTVLVLDLVTLKPIERYKVDDGDLNAGFYEPTTKRVHMIVGSRPKTTTWITLYQPALIRTHGPIGEVRWT
jgi:hypothetical protein